MDDNDARPGVADHIEVDEERFTIDPATRLGYVPGLDGVRALAVLAVMAGHTASAVAPGGFSGVRLFFVLSGFLITTLLVEEFSDRGVIRLGAFYMRRALRLLPALLFLLAVYLVALALFDGVHAVTRLSTTLVTILLYVSNWRFIFHAGGGDLGHLWSLSVEEQFYFLWPIGLFFMLRHLKPRTMLIVTALVGCGSWLLSEGLALAARGSGSINDVDTVRSVTQRHAFYGTDAVAYALIAGCLFALLRSSGRLRRSDGYQRFLGVAGLVGVGMYGIQVLFLPAPRIREIDLLFLTFGFLAIILSVVDLPHAPLSKLLSMAPLRAIGRVSYGLYLWHFPILAMLHRHQPHMSVPERTFWAAILTTGITIISYRLIERPALRLKKRFVSDPLAAGHPE
jgi:peptidoglycan/LPS O-acetylase OafA/YrhL